LKILHPIMEAESRVGPTATTTTAEQKTFPKKALLRRISTIISATIDAGAEIILPK
jgi:hypothetical protein